MGINRSLEVVVPYSKGHQGILKKISSSYRGKEIWINQSKIDDRDTLSLLSSEFEKLTPIDYLEYNISVLDSEEINSGIVTVRLVDNGLQLGISLTSVVEVDDSERVRALDLDDLASVLDDPLDYTSRFSDLDYDDRGREPPKRARRDRPVDLRQVIDMDSYKRKYEAQLSLIQKQRDDLELKSFTSEVGNEVVKVTSKVKNMSSEEAYDRVVDARKRWKKTDPYLVDARAEQLADKWYGKTVNLFDSFSSLSNINKAASLLAQLSKIDKDIFTVKKKSEKDKLEKQKKEVESDIETLLGDSLSHMTRKGDIDDQLSFLNNIRDSYEEYISDFEGLTDDWNVAISRMKGEQKNVELIDQLSSLYLRGQYNSLMPMYQKLINVDPPTLFDQYIESPQVMRSACLNMQIAFRKALSTFNRVYGRIIDDLEDKLGKLAFSRSLF